MTIVVDASVATKWVLPEDGSDRASALRRLGEEFIAPGLIAAEIGNAVWKRVIWKDFPTTDALRALHVALAHFSQISPVDNLAARATEIAIDLKHPIYDCFYLALAEGARCPLITADTRLVAAAKKMKGIEVRPL